MGGWRNFTDLTEKTITCIKFVTIVGQKIYLSMLDKIGQLSLYFESNDRRSGIEIHLVTNGGI